jgi:DNA-binding NtrC family response regulator
MSESETRAGRPPTLAELERGYVIRLLDEAAGNRSQVARLMGVSYPTVAKKIAAYAIPSARRRSKRES